MLTRDAILQVEDLPRQEVEVPEWGAVVFVRTMTAGERERWEEGRERHRHAVRAYTAACTVCDESGKLMFTEADIPALNRKSATALARIFAAALGISAVQPEDLDAIEKKSDPAPSGDSSTGSPPTSA